MRAVTNSEPVVVLCQPTCAGGQPAKADARQTCAASKQVRIAKDKCRPSNPNLSIFSYRE